MMYGFGDSKPPDIRSVRLVESMVVEHLHDILMSAVRVAEWQGREKVDDKCILDCVRQDAKRYKKLNYLLETNSKIKVFDSRLNNSYFPLIFQLQEVQEENKKLIDMKPVASDIGPITAVATKEPRGR